jgi:hypothetical protein
MPQPMPLTPLSSCQLNSDGRIYAAGQAPGTSTPFLYEMGMGTTGWAGNSNITAATGTPAPSGDAGSVVSAVLAGFSPRVYTTTADRRVFELAWLGNRWGSGELTSKAGLPIAAGSPLALGVIAQARPNVYMLGQNNGIYEIAWTGSAWQAGIISAGPKTVEPADPRGPLACLMADATARSVFYLTGQKDGYVSQLVRQPSGAWDYLNVTAAASGARPAASTRGPMACLGLSASDPRVYYASGDGHVHQLRAGGGPWQDLDLTQAAQAPRASLAGSNLACCAVGGSPRVYYLSEQGHITEIRPGLSQAWQSQDITEHVGVPPVTNLASQLTGCALDNGQLRLYYQGADGHLHELAWAA